MAKNPFEIQIRRATPAHAAERPTHGYVDAMTMFQAL